MVVQQFQQLVNTAFLGQINSNYFSAVGNSIFIIILTLSFFWSSNTGTSVLMAQNIGANKIDAARKFGMAALKYNSLLSLILFVFWFTCSKYVFILMGVKEPILNYAVNYTKIFSFIFIIVGVDTTITAILQGIGYTKPLIYTGILKGMLNVVLDYILIFGNFGFPRMELEGAAIATVISNFVGTGVMIYIVLVIKKKTININFIDIIKSKLSHYKDVLRLGLPSGVEEIIWHIGNLTIVRFLNVLGTKETGIYTLIISIEITAFIFYNGFAKAAQTLVGNRTGEGNIFQAKKDGLLCLKYSIFVTIFFVFAFLIVPKQILSIFTSDKNLIDSIFVLLMAASLYLIPKAVNIVIGHGIRGYGDTKWMLYTQIFGTIFVIITSYLFIFILKFGILGVFFTIISDETIRAIINTIRFLKGKDFFNNNNKDKEIYHEELKESA
jgi:putative MATE family efflux protein